MDFNSSNRKIIDNVVHYGVKNRVKPVPIYDFEDFQPIFEFEMEQAQKDEGKYLTGDTVYFMTRRFSCLSSRSYGVKPIKSSYYDIVKSTFVFAFTDLYLVLG